MRVAGFRSIYSGLKDPEMELNPETSRKICDLLYQAFEVSETPARHHLGPSGYVVYWEEDSLSVRVYVYDGIIEIRCFGGISYVKDTVGLEGYLKDILSPLGGAMPGTVLKQ